MIRKRKEKEMNEREMNESNINISIQNVYKSFGDTEVLKGVSMEVLHGDTLAIIGHSGGGKSTLLQCINKLIDIDRGKIIVDGYDVTDPNTNINEVRQHIGMVFQQFNLFKHLNAMGNVTLGLMRVKGMERKESEERAAYELERVGLGHRIKHYPSQLSGGEQQRVAIARALAMDPSVVLFDEPTSSLDPSLTGEVLDVMCKLADEGMTMVVVTHEMGFAKKVANKLALLENGQVVEQGNTGDIFDTDKYPLIRAFLSRTLHM